MSTADLSRAHAAGEALDEALSAVMDGRATPNEWARVNAAWEREPELRERWALWHAAADGLRSAELPALHRDPAALLDALHARLPAKIVDHPRRRDWLAPLAVAAGFVAMVVGLGGLKPPSAPEIGVAAAPLSAPLAAGLTGMSFAQAAAGRALPGWTAAQAAGLPLQTAPEVIDWGPALPDAAASGPQLRRLP